MQEERDAQSERERLALVITLGALNVLLWEPKEESGVNAAYHKLLTHAEQVIRREILPRYSVPKPAKRQD